MSEQVVDVTTAHNSKFRTHRPIASRIRGATPPDAYDVVRWPEFNALAKRLGIELSLPFRDLVIRIPMDGAVEVIQSYLADDIDQQNAKTVFEVPMTNEECTQPEQ